MQAPAAERVAAVCALLRIPGIGARKARRALERCGPPEQWSGANRRELQIAGLPETALRAVLEARPEKRDIAWTSAENHHLLLWGEAGYPALLGEIPDPPPALFISGDPNLLSQPQIAIVGARNPTMSGREIAAEFAGFLVGAGFVITSGLALGIDAAAHSGALAGPGQTLAVMGTGPDRVYPRRHVDLAEKIVATGALISEFPPGIPPLPEHFPRRNRIISGLSLGTLVVEAAFGSGSLITARYALEQGREVFAVPGSILSPLSRGCHALIREGAALVERGADILESLGTIMPVPTATSTEAGQTNEYDPQYHLLLDALGFNPVGIDALAERCGLTPQAVSSMLLILELQGEVEALPGARYARIRRNEGIR